MTKSVAVQLTNTATPKTDSERCAVADSIERDAVEAKQTRQTKDGDC